jgi:hypothetical protein
VKRRRKATKATIVNNLISSYNVSRVFAKAQKTAVRNCSFVIGEQLQECFIESIMLLQNYDLNSSTKG